MPSPSQSCFMNFQLLRLDSSYHSLMSNEKVVAKQEFLSSLDAEQRRIPIATYALTGLRADCDLLLWRVASSLEQLQDMSSRLQSSGMGKFIVPVYSFLGAVSDASYVRVQAADKSDAPRPQSFGAARYLFVQPLIAAAGASRAEIPKEFSRTAAAHGAVRMHAADCAGFDDPDYLFAFETDDPAAWSRLAIELRGGPIASLTERETPTFAAIARDVRDLVDEIG